MSRLAVRSPSRRTCTAVFLAGTLLVLTGEAVVVALLGYSVLFVPQQVPHLISLALYGAVPVVTCTAGALVWRAASRTDERCPQPHEDGLRPSTLF